MLQGYLAHEKTPAPTVGCCLGPYAIPRGGAFLFGASTPVFAQVVDSGNNKLLLPQHYSEIPS